MRVDEAPYPGLRSFNPNESDIFFGRDECVDTMLGRLAATRFLAVLGSSGIGKSSLVKTGLLSALQMGLLRGAGSSWLVIDFQPGQPEGSPLRNLVRRLLEKAGKAATPANIAGLHAQFIQDGPRALLKWCREGHLPEGTNLLLLVDQFEELFRYQDYSSSEEAEAFVALLLESRQPLEAKSPQMAELPIYVTLTMRSEFLGACSLIQNLPEAITEGAFLTPRMTRGQYREAILGPAEVCGIKIEETLVNRVLNDLAAFAPWDEEGAEQQGPSERADRTDAQDQLVRLARRADQLPILQHALNQIWRRACERRRGEQKLNPDAADRPIELTLDDYKEIGGLENALNAHANAVLDGVTRELGANVERTAERLFRALVTGSAPSDAIRRPAPLKELIDITGDEEGVRAIAQAFRADDCNFLRPDPAIALAPAIKIDISHESLIRQWQRLSQWVTTEAIAAQQWRRLNDRFNQREPLQGRVLDNLVAWRDEIRPNAAWAKRYGGDYDSVSTFLEDSERAEKRRRWARSGIAAGLFATVFVWAGTMFYLWQRAEQSLAQTQLEHARAEGNYAIAKEVLRGLTFDFVGSLATGRYADQNQITITEVTDAFREAKASLDKLAEANPDDVELRGIQADILDKFIDGYQAAGDAYNELALNVANEANAVLKELIKREPDKASWQTKLSSNLGKIGDLKQRLGDIPVARTSFEDALSIDRALMLREPGHEDHPRQAALELMNIGDLQRRAKDSAGALASYQEALTLRNKLAALYSILPVYQQDVALVLDKIGDLKSDLGDRPGALESYQQELRVDRQIVGLKFGVTDRNYTDVSMDLRKIAPLQEQLGDDAGALKSYQKSLEIDQAYADRAPDNGQVHRRVAATAEAIGVLQLKSGNADAAKKSFADALAAQILVARLAYEAAVKDPSKVKDVVTPYGHVTWFALLTSQPQRAANYAEIALKVDSSKTWINVNLAHAYLFLGRYDDAKAIYLKVKDTSHSADGKRKFVDDIRDDFDIFRKLGIATPDFDRMVSEIGI